MCRGKPASSKEGLTLGPHALLHSIPQLDPQVSTRSHVPVSVNIMSFTCSAVCSCACSMTPTHPVSNLRRRVWTAHGFTDSCSYWPCSAWVGRASMHMLLSAGLACLDCASLHFGCLPVHGYSSASSGVALHPLALICIPLASWYCLYLWTTCAGIHTLLSARLYELFPHASACVCHWPAHVCVCKHQLASASACLHIRLHQCAFCTWTRM